METTEKMELKLKAHEDICALRYDNIDKRLEAGSKRFDKIDKLILGIYGIILSFTAYLEFLK
ncbi:hypothetical protein [uncultured Winogradskyella sp.]|jgi:hypothetical protein|uniref:hypothetical protein n=1 Tax=uncultured Winogradskyella sp. TaxID=395353 RepID=UPI0030D801EB|tara:strand:+ start:55 stop:240 length:186 start_codon:yes stop_codon:yes gene_type:complete